MNGSDATAASPTTASTGTGALRSDRIPSLDGYRALAALGVLAYHTVGRIGFLRPSEPGAHLVDNLGNFGVAVFFLLSGVVIFRPFVAASLDDGDRPATAPFLIRRALRIFPGYWIALIAWAMSVDRSTRDVGTIAGKIFLTDLYDQRMVFIPGLGVSWTLNIELAFYLTLPIYAAALHMIARRRPTRAARLRVHLVGLGVLYLAPNLYRLLFDRWGLAPTALNWLPHYLDWFALGMLLATLFTWRGGGGAIPRPLEDLARRPYACWAIAATAYAMVVVLKGDHIHFDLKESTAQTAWRMVFQGAAAFFVLLPAVLGRPDTPSMRLFNTRPIVYLGTISYGIYLWHTIVLIWIVHWFPDHSPRVRSVLLILAVMAITLPIAAASYAFIEQPFSRLYHGAARRQPSPPDLAAAAPTVEPAPAAPLRSSP